MISKTSWAITCGLNVGDTKDYWESIESKGKEYMIISVVQGDSVRPLGMTGENLDFAKVLNNFVIIDGIDYRSKNSSGPGLWYMEV